ncbi:hypothetical protein PISL3812_08342 [Talaromyces islandicus]|uniref:Asl1-like glycosyl hydrolase catalytic domain-containing protein n=1 Tax=Talaromyces islandicus TaxID=28573 RepID=A0A0U1M6R5_TALIS|nr:hypothetical protein PISL3812_08342 [Talaromyces islandicus]
MVSFTTFLISSLAGTSVAAPTNAHLAKRSSSKKGISYNDATLVSLFTDGSWVCNWEMAVDGPLPGGVDYVPMMRGTGSESGWDAAVQKALASGSTHLLGFNEPDLSTQANLDAATAAALYKQYITPYAKKATLVTPAVTNGAAPMGLTWMEEFLRDCSGECGVSVMAFHYYADDNVSNFENYVNKAISTAANYGISEVWITEFQATGVSDDAQATFINSVVPWLDQKPAVGRYAYFYAADGYMTSGGALSEIGSAYNSAE